LPGYHQPQERDEHQAGHEGTQLMAMTLGNPVEIPEVNGGFNGEIIQT